MLPRVPPAVPPPLVPQQLQSARNDRVRYSRGPIVPIERVINRWDGTYFDIIVAQFLPAADSRTLATANPFLAVHIHFHGFQSLYFRLGAIDATPRTSRARALAECWVEDAKQSAIWAARVGPYYDPYYP